MGQWFLIGNTAFAAPLTFHSEETRARVPLSNMSLTKHMYLNAFSANPGQKWG